jgi:hypothetical protein
MAAITIEFEFRNQRFKDAAKGLMAFGEQMKLDWAKLPPVLRRELKDYLDTVAHAMAKRHGNPWPGGTTNSSLSRRSGALINAIKRSVKVTGKDFADIEGRIGVPLIYGSVHEYGATIRPKKAKYLTIPLPAALNPDGTPKKRGARDWDKTFVIRSKNGSLLIVQKVGNQIVPLYVLKTEVRIPPRLQLGKTLTTGLDYFVDRAGEAMLKALRDVK